MFTLQFICAGYALGSLLGGLSLKYIGGRGTFALMSLLCLLTAVMSTIVFAFLNFRTKRSKGKEKKN